MQVVLNVSKRRNLVKEKKVVINSPLGAPKTIRKEPSIGMRRLRSEDSTKYEQVIVSGELLKCLKKNYTLVSIRNKRSFFQLIFSDQPHTGKDQKYQTLGNRIDWDYFWEVISRLYWTTLYQYNQSSDEVTSVVFSFDCDTTQTGVYFPVYPDGSVGYNAITPRNYSYRPL